MIGAKITCYTDSGKLATCVVVDKVKSDYFRIGEGFTIHKYVCVDVDDSCVHVIKPEGIVTCNLNTIKIV